MNYTIISFTRRDGLQRHDMRVKENPREIGKMMANSKDLSCDVTRLDGKKIKIKNSEVGVYFGDCDL